MADPRFRVNTPELRRAKQACAMMELRGRRKLAGLCSCGGKREVMHYAKCAKCRERRRTGHKEKRCSG